MPIMIRTRMFVFWTNGWRLVCLREFEIQVDFLVGYEQEFIRKHVYKRVWYVHCLWSRTYSRLWADTKRLLHTFLSYWTMWMGTVGSIQTIKYIFRKQTNMTVFWLQDYRSVNIRAKNWGWRFSPHHLIIIGIRIGMKIQASSPVNQRVWYKG